TATRRSAGMLGSLSAMRRSSDDSYVRANRNNSSSMSARCPSTRATSKRAWAYASMRGLSATVTRSDLVDVVLDQARLRVAVEVLLDDLLGQLDRQLRDLAVQLAHRTLGREADVLGRALAEFGRVGLGARDQLATHLVRALARLLDDR